MYYFKIYLWLFIMIDYISVIKWVEWLLERKKLDGCRICLKVDVVRKNVLIVVRILFIFVFIIGDLVC